MEDRLDMQAGEDARANLRHRWIDGGSPAQREFLREVLACHGGGDDSLALPPDAPWNDAPEAFLSVVERERVGPLLHRAVGEREELPGAVRAALRHSYRLTALRNMIRLRSLEECLTALAAARVEVIVLKGAALVELVYGNLALRPMVDVDLLVRRDDVAATCRVLGDLGFLPARDETHPGVLVEHENELQLSRARGAVRDDVDLHWSLIDSPFYQEQLAMRWFWETARTQPIGRVQARTLGAEALLLHLCAHLALHHGGSGLLWWYDIGAVLRSEGAQMDWDLVLARAREYRLLLPVQAVLVDLACAWRAPVPARVLERLAAEEPTPREADLFARLSGGESAGERLWTDLRSMSGWGRRLRFAATNLFPSPAYMRRRYAIEHPALLPAYYGYRWLRGGRDVLAPLLRRRRTDSSGEAN